MELEDLKQTKYYIAAILFIIGFIIAAIFAFTTEQDYFFLLNYYLAIVGTVYVFIGFLGYMYVNYVVDPYQGTVQSKITEEELEEYQENRAAAKKQRQDMLMFFVIGLLFFAVWYITAMIIGNPIN